MKICTSCNLHKSNFSKRKNNKDGLSYFCKDCERYKRKERYNSDIANQRNKINKNRRLRIDWLQSLKTKPCKDCNKMYPPCCMDYDHLPGTNKIKNVSRMILDNTPKSVILEEIEKCDLVCILCHNTRTKNRSGKQISSRNIEIINKAKNVPCNICGVRHEPYNMQFDHLDPSSKVLDVCQMKRHSIKNLMLEISKCQILCALCHRIKSIIEQKAKFN